MTFEERGIDVINKEIDALEQLRDHIDTSFSQAVSELHRCKGKVVVTGVGKSGHIGRKIAATMASLGTPAFFLHPDDALHGDLGMVGSNDVVIAISNSGESNEIINLLPGVRTIGARVIAITHNPESTLAANCDILCRIPNAKEACVLGIAPTSSTTATLVLGDALAVALSEAHHINKEEYAVFHPSGTLGKRLTIKVADVMRKNEQNAVVCSGARLKDAIEEIGKKELGAVLVSDGAGTLLGLITDGDIRRSMERGDDIYSCGVESIMTKQPVTIDSEAYAVQALEIMKQGGKRCSVLPVVDEMNKICGIVSISDLLRLGLIYDIHEGENTMRQNNKTAQKLTGGGL